MKFQSYDINVNCLNGEMYPRNLSSPHVEYRLLACKNLHSGQLTVVLFPLPAQFNHKSKNLCANCEERSAGIHIFIYT